jgi:hypothetical protein
MALLRRKKSFHAALVAFDEKLIVLTSKDLALVGKIGRLREKENLLRSRAMALLERKKCFDGCSRRFDQKIISLISKDLAFSVKIGSLREKENLLRERAMALLERKKCFCSCAVESEDLGEELMKQAFERRTIGHGQRL